MPKGQLCWSGNSWIQFTFQAALGHFSSLTNIPTHCS